MKFEDLTRNEGFAISELLHFLNLGSGAQAHKSINNKSYQQLSSPQLQWKLKVNNSRKVPLSIAIWRKLNIFYAPFNDVLKDVLTGAFKNI